MIPVADQISIPSYGRFNSSLEVVLIAEDKSKVTFLGTLNCERSQSMMENSIRFIQNSSLSTSNVVLHYAWHSLNVLKQLPSSPCPVCDI